MAHVWCIYNTIKAATEFGVSQQLLSAYNTELSQKPWLTGLFGIGSVTFPTGAKGYD